jgi:flagellar hook-associated protein 2
MSPISLSGLASGIDTDAIVTQLMALEGQSRTRLELSDTRAEARQSGLRDLATKLGAVRDAATAMKSTTSFASVQKIASSDPARIGVSAAAGAAPGSREITVRTLAVAAQHAFTYTPDAAAQTIEIGSFSLAVDPNSNAATVAAALNGRVDSPVSAVVVSDKLVLTSRTTGAGSAINLTATPLLTDDPANAVYTRTGADAAYSVDGGAERTSSSNVLKDVILGVDVTLKGTSAAPISLTVSDPAPDVDSAKAKITAFVSAYNSAVDFIRGKLSEERVKNPTTSADAIKGLFHGDSMFSGALSSMRSQIGDLSSFGISTGAPSGTATVSADAIAGKLRVDDTKLAAALAGNPDTLRAALNGLGQRVSDVVTPVAGPGVTAALDGVTGERKNIADAIARTDVRLADKEKRLRAQFAAMESALAASQAAQTQLASQLSSLSH